MIQKVNREMKAEKLMKALSLKKEMKVTKNPIMRQRVRKTVLRVLKCLI